MKLTEEEKKKLQEKIDQEPAARKGRNEKAIGISVGVITGVICGWFLFPIGLILVFPISIILAIYWLLRGKRTRGTYTLVTAVLVMVIAFGIKLFIGAFLITLFR